MPQTQDTHYINSYGQIPKYPQDNPMELSWLQGKLQQTPAVNN